MEAVNDAASVTPRFDARVFAKQAFYHMLFPLSLPFALWWDGLHLAWNMGFTQLSLRALITNYVTSFHVIGLDIFYLYFWMAGTRTGVSGAEVVVYTTLFLTQKLVIAIKYAYMLPADYERLLRTRELPERQGLEQLLGGWDRLHPRFAFLVVEQTVVRMGAHIGYRSIEFRGKDMPFIRAALAGTIRRAARELDTYLADFCRDPRHGDWFNDGRRTMRALCEARGPGGRAGGGTAAAADEGGGDHSAHFSILSEVDQWSRGYIAGAPSEEGANRVSIVLLALHVLTQSRAEQAGFRLLRSLSKFILPACQVLVPFAARATAGVPLMGHGWPGMVLVVNVSLLLFMWTQIPLRFMVVGTVDYGRRLQHVRAIGRLLQTSWTADTLREKKLALLSPTATASASASTSNALDRFGSFRALLRGEEGASDATLRPERSLRRSLRGRRGSRKGGAGGNADTVDREVAGLFSAARGGGDDASSLPHMRLDAACNYKSWLLLRRLLHTVGLRFWYRAQDFTSSIFLLIVALLAWVVLLQTSSSDPMPAVDAFAMFNVTLFAVLWLTMIYYGHHTNNHAVLDVASLRNVQVGLRDTLSGSCGLNQSQFVVPDEVIRVITQSDKERPGNVSGGGTSGTAQTASSSTSPAPAHGFTAPTTASDDESSPSSGSRTTSAARTSSQTSSLPSGGAPPATPGRRNADGAAGVQEALSPQLSSQPAQQRGNDGRDGMDSTELAAQEVAREIAAAKQTRVAAHARRSGPRSAAPSLSSGSASPTLFQQQSSQWGGFDTLERAVPITTFNSLHPTTRGPIHHTVTVTAQNRLVECDALCSSIIRGVRADDESNPVSVLGIRASLTIVRTGVVLLLTGATTLVRFGMG